MANPETAIVAVITEYLTQKRVFHWRQNNTGKMPGGRYVSVRKGVPDIIAVKNGKAIFIEAKTKRGKLSPDQVEFARQAVLAGGEYIVARSVDDVISAGL